PPRDGAPPAERGHRPAERRSRWSVDCDRMARDDGECDTQRRGRSSAGVDDNGARMSGHVEGGRGNREVSPLASLDAQRRGVREEEGGSWGKPGFPHATEPKAREVPA